MKSLKTIEALAIPQTLLLSVYLADFHVLCVCVGRLHGVQRGPELPVDESAGHCSVRLCGLQRHHLRHLMSPAADDRIKTFRHA